MWATREGAEDGRTRGRPVDCRGVPPTKSVGVRISRFERLVYMRVLTYIYMVGRTK